MELIEDIKKRLEVEVREYSDEEEYFEGVVRSEDLGQLAEILRNSLGEPIKQAGKQARFPRHLNKLIGLIGGIRIEQSFYIKEGEGSNFVFAAIWPWQSDNSRVTLKIGWGRLSEL
ncbi:MAG: hypothetical protein JW800_04845 [Candidatus Omnitrophica bacterium]|nr:hypothetical protein [Candidatus Omnitrophota bacterium]